MSELSTLRPAAITFLALCFVSLTAAAQVNVTTYHNDISRTGQNTQETTLTPSNVNSTKFAPMFVIQVDGQVYAQPLVLSNVNLGSQGTHNVVYIATENDSVYAADANNGTIYWHVSLGTPASNTQVGCSDISPEYGITSTPVIDTTTTPPRLYVVALTMGDGDPLYQLHALNVETGADIFGLPTTIGPSLDGISFDSANQHIRPALLLENEHIIIGSGSHCDNPGWYGWVMSYSTSTLQQEAAFITEPTGNKAGVWMSGGGPAADASGNIYFATGNSAYFLEPNYGDAIVKLSPPATPWPVADYFSPSAGDLMGNTDNDVGSGGVLLIPGTSLLVQAGKEGVMYLVNTTTGDMGKYCGYENCPDDIVQEIDGQDVGVWGSPAYWNDNVYFGSANQTPTADSMKAFSFNANGSGKLSTSPTSVTPEAYAWPTPIPSVSSNGTADGIVWALDFSKGFLRAYNAANLGSEIYDGVLGANYTVKFAVPTIANGMVYTGTANNVTAFGLPPVPTWVWTYSGSETIPACTGDIPNFAILSGSESGVNSSSWSVKVNGSGAPINYETNVSIMNSNGVVVGGGSFSGNSGTVTSPVPIGTQSIPPTIRVSGSFYNTLQKCTVDYGITSYMQVGS
jgi:hypothetical protein